MTTKSIVADVWGFVSGWYDSRQIHQSILRQQAALQSQAEKVIPSDVFSREFAEWLTEQYRLAMQKGATLARDELITTINDLSRLAIGSTLRVTELETLVQALCKSFECYIATTKPKDEWDEYDSSMLPVWQQALQMVPPATTEKPADAVKQPAEVSESLIDTTPPRRRADGVAGFRCETSGGCCDTGLGGLLLVLYRGNHGWRTGSDGLAYARLPGQIYVEDLQPLIAGGGTREIVAVDLKSGRWKTIWASCASEVSYE